MTFKLPPFLLIALIGNSLFSQVPLEKGDISRLHDLVSANSSKTQSLVSNFKEEKHISALNNAIISEGVLMFLAPDKIKWDYQSPISNTTIIKGDQLYNQSKKGKNSLDLEKNKVFRKFNSLIVNSINGDLFDESLFDITYFKKEVSYLVKFKPKDNRIKKLISTIEIQFDLETAEVETIKLIENNKDFTLIEFYDRKTNVPINEEQFKI